jgi:hypothetical protein
VVRKEGLGNRWARAPRRGSGGAQSVPVSVFMPLGNLRRFSNPNGSVPAGRQLAIGRRAGREAAGSGGSRCVWTSERCARLWS